MFFGIFLWFYFISPTPFSKKKKKTQIHITITEQKEEKRKGNFIINAMWKTSQPKIAQLFVPDLPPA